MIEPKALVDRGRIDVINMLTSRKNGRGRGASVQALPTDSETDSLKMARESLRGPLIGIALFSVVTNLLMLASPLYMLEIYDRVLPSGSVPTLVMISIFIFAIYGVQAVIDAIRGRVLTRMGTALELQLGERVYRTLVRLSVRRGPSEALRPMRDLDSVRGFLSGLGPTVFFDLPWLPIYLAVISAFHPLLGLTALGGAVFLVVVTFVSEQMIRPITKATKDQDEERVALAGASARNAEALMTMGLFSRLAVRWKRQGQEYLSSQQRASDIAGGFGSLSKGFRMMLQSAVLGVGAALVIHQQATAGAIIAASILTARALAPVDLAISHWKGYVAARDGWERLRTFFEMLPAERDQLDLPQPEKSLVVQGLTIMPPSSKTVTVQNVNFMLTAGQALGIIGPSASGKSSLVRVLVGVWPAVRGSIRLDGAALEQWPEESRGRHIGYLPQSVELLAGTIAENIARFDTDATDEQIVAAGQAAAVHEMIVALPEGYATDVGENGSLLSAGQQQRIALARALFGDPFLVVLDEPNSNLDSEGETALTQAIVHVRQRGGIAIVVAHRPSALAPTDTILVMRQGRVESFGPRDEILRTVLRAAPAIHAAADPAAINQTN